MVQCGPAYNRPRLVLYSVPVAASSRSASITLRNIARPTGQDIRHGVTKSPQVFRQ
jgi:hypothetical protein